MNMTVPPVIEAMAAEGALRCPRCSGRLGTDGQGVRCDDCRTRFNAFNGVVDLFGLVDRATAIDPGPAMALAGPIMAALELPDDDAPTVREILRRTASMTSSNAEFDAEISDLADRFGIGPPLAKDGERIGPPAIDAGPLALVVERHYIPPSLPSSARMTCNVRFRNDGPGSISSSSNHPITVGFRWFDATGSSVDLAQFRTKFPIDLATGRAITLPIDLVVPDAPNSYTLLICPVIEMHRWVPECGIAVRVEVERSGSATPSVLDLRSDAKPHDYATEHEIAQRMLGETIDQLPRACAGRLLEIGGSTSPQSSWFGLAQVVNVDINLPLLELGALHYSRRAPAEVADALAFVCADANNLPFDDNTFDVVAMFSTLHHFAAPEALLAECRRVVRDDGIVAVLCEPVGSTLETDLTLRDLRKGINEQVFTVPEYLRIFAAAGLEPASGNLVGGSLRAFLRPAAGSGERFDLPGAEPPSLPADEAKPPRRRIEAGRYVGWIRTTRDRANRRIVAPFRRRLCK